MLHAQPRGQMWQDLPTRFVGKRSSYQISINNRKAVSGHKVDYKKQGK